MHAELVVYVGYGADELCEDLLNLSGLEGALVEEVVVELITCTRVSRALSLRRLFPSRRTWAVLQDQPDERFRDYDLVQPRNVRVYELAVVVDLAREIGIVLLRGLEDDLLRVNPCSHVSAPPHTLEPFVSLCVAKYTFPKLPFPISRPNV
jgi:hypothetical protein